MTPKSLSSLYADNQGIEHKCQKKEKIEGRVEMVSCFKHVEFEVIVQCVQQTVSYGSGVQGRSPGRKERVHNYRY